MVIFNVLVLLIILVSVNAVPEASCSEDEQCNYGEFCEETKEKQENKDPWPWPHFPSQDKVDVDRHCKDISIMLLEKKCGIGLCSKSHDCYPFSHFYECNNGKCEFLPYMFALAMFALVEAVVLITYMGYLCIKGDPKRSDVNVSSTPTYPTTSPQISPTILAGSNI